MSAQQPRTTRSAGTIFGLLGAAFVLLFGAVVVWIELDQQRLLGVMGQVQRQSLPQAMEEQRLVRNLELLRLEGERLLYSDAQNTRIQALYVLGMVSSHPSMQKNDYTRQLADDIGRFLQKVESNRVKPGSDLAMEWVDLSRSLAGLADQITTRQITRLAIEVEDMESVVRLGERKLLVALGLAALTMGGLLVWMLETLIKPLQKIDRALVTLDPKHPLPRLPATATTEIRTINDAIERLHDTMRENEEIRAGLELLATTDGLTGLTNRRCFMTQASSDIGRSHRYERPVSVALADLDHFKSVNDEYGHEAGDLVLQSVAQLMRDTLRQTDLFCRYGGEEFAFLFPETPLPEARALADRLRARLESLPIALPGGKTIHVTLSIGLVDASALSLEAALKRADESLYQAKAAGRNRIQLSLT